MVSIFASAAERAAWKTDMAWHNATFVDPAALLVLFILSLWFFFAHRKNAFWPLVLLICCVPSSQRINIIGADFTLLRIMICAGFVRLLSRRELRSVKLNRVDITYALYICVSTAAYCLQRSEFSSLIYMSGKSLDMFGAFIVTRALVRNVDDLWRFTTTLALLAIPISAMFLIEMLTGRNLFAFFGGVPAETIVREGRLRCQGAFSHPILAGVFWAAIATVLAAGVFDRSRNARDRVMFVFGFLGSSAIVVASSSSTPLLGYLSGFLFWVCWPLRSYIRYAFMAAPFALLCLHLVMDKPVWHLVTRVSAVGGSTAYHRFVLIDGAIKHFNEWWLMGTPWTGHWSEHFQTWDITNQYIFEGVRGGIWRLFLFCLLLFFVARSFGKAMSAIKDRSNKLLFWGWGSSVFVHAVCWIGVSYFGQIEFLWYITVGLAACVSDPLFPEDEPDLYDSNEHPGDDIACSV